MKRILIILVIVSGHFSAFGQVDTSGTKKIEVSDYQGMISFGLGAGTIGWHLAPLVQFGYKSHSITGRLTLCNEYQSSSGSFFSSSPKPKSHAAEVAILYGYGITLIHEIYNPSIIQFQAGIGEISGITRGKRIPGGYEFDFSNNYEEINHSAIGFAYSIQLIQAFSKNMGWGVKFYGNANKELPMNGLAFTYSIGQLY